MEESLSDFQEKKSYTASRKAKKVGTKNKPKKRIKKVKGQKDIRSALDSKKNELVAYSNDFDKICKQSGIDVDSEQLQLAIALSKSLQQPQGASESSDSQSSGSLTSQERTGQIRTTLLEYGFKVPEIKITAKKSRKLKKHRNNYKLLLASEAEKQQLISDRYSQVLFLNIKNTTAETCSINQTSESRVPLYNIATNTSYDLVKSDINFYVQDLIEINHVTVGGLLKDWSEIPGRPATPKLALLEINFSNIDCSYEELNTILAGTLDSAQEIVKEKYKLLEKEVILKTPKESIAMSSEIDLKMDVSKDMLHKSQINGTDEPMRASKSIVNHPVIILDFESPKILSINSQVRSCSPDIFDDEVSLIMDKSKENTEALSQENPCTDITKTRSNFMDLTECVNIVSQKNLNIDKTSLQINSRMLPQLSQEDNKTKRRSNDFMEITDCVETLSQPVTKKDIENIDLTQSFEQCDQININIEGANHLENNEVEKIDLTQLSHSNDSLPFVEISGKDKTLDDTIILTEDAYLDESNNPKSEILGSKKPLKVNDKIAESYTHDNILRNLQDLLDFKDGEKSLVLIETKRGDADDGIANNEVNEQLNKGDLPEEPRERIFTNDTSPVHQLVSKCESFFEEFIHKHSDSSKEHTEDGIMCVIESIDHSIVNETVNNQKNYNDHRNLTQSPGSSFMKERRVTVKNKEQLLDELFCEGNKQNNDANDIMNNKQPLSNDIDLTQCSGSSVGNVESIDKGKSKEPLEGEICVNERHDKSEIQGSFNDNDSISNDIDLTQSLDLSREKVESILVNNTSATKYYSASTKVSHTNSLGKFGDVSIDYDEIFDDMIASHTNQSSSYKSESNKVSETYDSIEKLTSRSHSASTSSQNSDIFDISDNELNYSINKSRNEIKVENFGIGGLSFMNDLSEASSSKLSSNVENITNAHLSINESYLPEVKFGDAKYDKVNNVIKLKATPAAISLSTPFRNVLNNGKHCTQTPSDSDYIIRSDQVSPMLDYESLTTPERNRELDKYGLKPFKRKRAIQLLTHLYNQTHPIVESCSTEDLPSPTKKRKKDNHISNTHMDISPNKLMKSPAKSKVQSPRKKHETQHTRNKDILEQIGEENEDVYRVTNEAPIINNIECSEEEWVFQKKEKAKLQSCRVPLHIAFYNYVSCREGLREAILRYEPVNIDVIHRELVEYGHKYDAKELLKFMDKKCITVKTTDSNNARTSKKHY